MPDAMHHGPMFPRAPRPTWPDATWIGEVVVGEDGAEGPEGADGATGPDVARDVSGAFDDVTLAGSAGYARARLLVRTPERLIGMVTVPVRDGVVTGADLTREVQAARAAAGPAEPAPAPDLSPVTVVLCTRDRPEELRTALRSVLEQDHPSFEVIVVDNAPATDATQRVVAELADPRLRIVTERRPGLSNARNAGVSAARTAWVAFTDDDVRCDPGWLRGLARGITRGTDCVCVTGFVPTGELRTPAQAWFDSRIGWNRVFAPRVFRLDSPPPDLPLFPFQVGSFGAGANFAARRDVIEELGGFDPLLGAGTPSKGGEDIDFFFRVVVAGRTLVYEPSAVVWHRHRETEEALRSQAVGYGRGFSAWATKTVLTPRTFARGLATVARRGRFDTAPLAAYRAPLADEAPALPGGVDVLRIEHRATLTGPPVYLWSRAQPLVRRGRGALTGLRERARRAQGR